MSENVEPAADHERRKASTEPGIEGEGGQYTEGDYGDAAVVGDADESKDGEYTGGDYGDAAVVGDADESKDGEYTEGDYGDAGAVPAREAEVDEDKDS